MKRWKIKVLISTICLTAAVVLAAFTVYAWLIIFEDVRTGGINASVTNDDVIKFDVKVYYLDKNLADDGKTLLGYNKSTYQQKTGNVSAGLSVYNVDDGADGELTSEKDEMRPYGVFGSNFATAVLIEIDLEIRPNENYYRVYASNDSTYDDGDVRVTEVKKDHFTSPLSNVIGFNKAAGSDFDSAKDSGLFNTTGVIGGFYDAEDNKISTKILQNDIRPLSQKGATENYNEKLYFIMDYIDDPFARLSSKMLEAGGTLNAQLRFLGDITISLETYDPTSTTN